MATEGPKADFDDFEADDDLDVTVEMWKARDAMVIRLSDPTMTEILVAIPKHLKDVVPPLLRWAIRDEVWGQLRAGFEEKLAEEAPEDEDRS